LVRLRNTDPARASSADLPDPRASRPSLTSMLPGASLFPSASTHTHAILLSAVAGYIDAAGFACLVGLFPAHLTGELVVDAVALTSSHPHDHPTHWWTIPVFISAVIVASFTARLFRRAGLPPLAGLLGLVTLALAAFSLSDPLTHVLHAGPSLTLLFGGGCAVTAMGFQNALMREALRTSCPTTVMTGNLTQVVIEFADRLLGKLLKPHPHDRRPKSRLGPVSGALAAFLVCAVLGGWLTHVFGSASVMLPTLVTAVLTGWAWQEGRQRFALTAPVAKIATPRLPTFEPAQVWPESLLPHPPSAANEPVSLAQLRTSPATPTVSEPVSPTPTRFATERRSISGTQLATRFREELLEEFRAEKLREEK
jgi:uncharacterized membrane protein YoaK (UPF0700 family)